MQMAGYAGFPAALNGLFAAKEVFVAKRRLGDSAHQLLMLGAKQLAAGLRAFQN